MKQILKNLIAFIPLAVPINIIEQNTTTKEEKVIYKGAHRMDIDKCYANRQVLDVRPCAGEFRIFIATEEEIDDD